MSDDPNLEDDLPVDESVMDDDALAGAEDAPAIDTHAILAEAQMERMHRQAYWHGTDKQLFAFLFANCLFFAGTLVAWMRSAPGDPAGDPSTYVTGMHTIRGAFIFALSIYGFWTGVFNIWCGQMKVWPYLLNAILALWVGIAGFAHTIGGDEWKKAKDYLESLESKSFQDDILVPLSTVAPGYWLLSFGGLIVVWVIIKGLMHGSAAAKGGAADEGAGKSSRRRR
ncbi:MAG: hypothetical protein QNJ90_08770 [Planctomycetota bacterium]|nr:hypothetical protein [Planctomycetota bacterium]